MNWWDAQLNAAAPQNILSDEDPTTPSTREAWQNWHLYDTLLGGTLPAAWVGNPKAELEDHGPPGLGALGDPAGVFFSRESHLSRRCR